ncbi:MAG TPA: DNA-directed RNA polymerase subunit beta [Candidatus Omnitrophica bacterium]|nr:DNA-directed RNA polymerase subunit beta [Candidatus Omnitrophota bacterium]
MIKRKSFAKIQDKIEPQNLVEIQTASYDSFLGKSESTRDGNYSLEAIFKEIFPIENIDGSCRLEYVDYKLLAPKYDEDESRRRGVSFAAPLRVKLRLKTPDDIREQEVYMGTLPLMTKTGAFIINGADRVIVSQLHRSPGVCFESSTHPKGKTLYSVRIIPYRGAWLEFNFDINDILNVTIDRRRRLLATTLLRIFGCSSDEDIIDAFYERRRVRKTDREHLKLLQGKFLASDVIDEKTNEVIAHKWEKLDSKLIDLIAKKDIGVIEVLDTDSGEIILTLKKDRTHSKDEALIDIYRKLRPGDPPTKEAAKTLVDRLFFDPKRYDISREGRYILNRKLNMKTDLSKRLLDLKTLVEAIKYLINLKNGEGQVDDIDHLGNRRVRTVAELLQNQFRVGLARIERTARERMNIYDKETMMPHHLINSKLISSIINDFFGRSQLSQFMDQTNPLAELTHKRRLSALGPGGLSRERAGFEVRDIHYSHYGRICPIETPEGPNIGLICSLSCYARVNNFGFLETPYRKVENERVTNKIEFLSADVEDNYIIAQANAKLDEDGKFIEEKVFCRYKDDFIEASPKDIEYIDISPRQLVSVAASLIPFLEHDDANRALMGSNMQRQAVPLLETEAPFVGTGMERRVARDSGAVVISESDGIVSHVQSDLIIIGNKEYRLKKFIRSNASTCINQRPIVKIGQKVKKGQIIADGAATKEGELALGRNVLVAFMPWRGYNFEDAILISEKLVKEDVYTSVHIEEFEIEARDTRLGPEEISCDIPNVGEAVLRNLDENGIVRVGAEVKPGDILVGKITPKSETELSPEEKLLKAIFGEKAGDVKDTSLRVPPGVEGIVIDVREFSRRGAKVKTKKEKELEREQIKEIRKNYEKDVEKFNKERLKELSKLLVGSRLTNDLVERKTKKVIIRKGRKISKKDIERLADVKVNMSTFKIQNNRELEEEVKKVERIFEERINELRYERDRQIDNIKRGDELPPGVIKRVKVYVASKRKLSVGDKMAGRHGNKGVIAKILPEEDMPFLPDGTPVEIVLNPLGVPSRMNVGQILETHLGWAAKTLGFYVETPVFNGANEKEIIHQLREASLPEDGKSIVYDGYTGEPFDQRITVGYIYMMKLIHMVDDKIHARSIGPYSLVTQQPLGGKAQFGGQRFGEMEVWALEAYGAAYTLQELLTVKSDDVLGRTRIYESIVKGENALQPGTPESFNVLIKELQSLALDVRAEKKR